MSNLNGLAVLSDGLTIDLINRLEIKPEGAAETHGTDVSKQVITWGAEFGAEIIKLVQEETQTKGIGTILKVLSRFVDDLMNVAPIISKLKELKAEQEDLSESEAVELKEWLNVEVPRALVGKGVVVKHNSITLVLKIIGLAIDIIALHDELG